MRPSPLTPQAVGAYREAQNLLRLGRARVAEQRLRALLDDYPAAAPVAATLARALVQLGRAPEALTLLQPFLQQNASDRALRSAASRACLAAGDAAAAVAVLGEAPATNTMDSLWWLARGDALAALEEYGQARAAYERARQDDPHAATLERARHFLVARDRKSAEAAFRQVLRFDAANVGALCGLAAVSLAAGHGTDAERLLRHALLQSPHLPLARRGLAQALLENGKLLEALETSRSLLLIEPENVQNWVTVGTVATRLMRQDEALAAYEEAARLEPREPGLSLSIGHLLKTLGRRAECERAYRRCLELDPDFGEAYWALADLKNYDFDAADLGAMARILDDPDATDLRRAQVYFALGRARENRHEDDLAFAAYERGNRLRRASSPFSIETFEAKTERVIACFDEATFARLRGAGDPGGAPIFIIGLPRSGSTLVEQILASHSAVEGTFELPNVLRLVREFDHSEPSHDAYPEVLQTLSQADWTALGARYLEETAPLRTGRARFIDKMPNNFSHVGLIHAMLPNATIVDVRRHPLDSCFSTYKQYFAEGQSFSYDLADLGRYYRSYLRLMDHWHRVLPGKVLTLCYERLVRDPETSIRALLAHCNLPFEPACLAFHETRRAVRTASAEQVRQPLYTSGIGYWRRFAAHLSPLAEALGEALARADADTA